MKHSVKITLILLSMFFVAQMIGLYVAHVYLPDVTQVKNETTGEMTTQKIFHLPYGLDPPKDIAPKESVLSIISALIIAVVLMFILMKFKAETFLRLWFTLVVILGIALAVNAFIKPLPSASIIALVIAIPLGILKIFKRNIIVHNATELLIYPGIASVFIPILDMWTVIFLLVFISFYDMYAVWHAGFMQKMAKYQIQKLKLFSGFFVPYVSGKDRIALRIAKEKGKTPKNVKVNLAILGGGDVVFPILLAGVVLRVFGLWQAITISIGATAALAYLFYRSEKGKFYPAMPFIATGCFVALAIIYIF